MGSRATVKEQVKPVQGLVPFTQAAGTVNGAGVSRQGFNEVLMVLSIGVATNDAATLDVKLQESDVVGSGFADVPSGAFAQKLGTDDNTLTTLLVDLANTARKEFIRVVSLAGGTASFARSCELLLARPHKLPAE